MTSPLLQLRRALIAPGVLLAHRKTAARYRVLRVLASGDYEVEIMSGSGKTVLKQAEVKRWFEVVAQTREKRKGK